MSPLPPEQPNCHFSLAVTGHRHTNTVLEANLAAVETALTHVFDAIDARLSTCGKALEAVRLHNLLAEGVDQIAARNALARNWQIIAPLPFGKNLNAAINAMPETAADARALISGAMPQSAEVQERAAALAHLADNSQLFEMAEQDSLIADLYLAALEEPANFERLRTFEAQCSDRAAMAGQIMIERADLLIAVWDGNVSNLSGGTGHTVMAALDCACPVLLMDPAGAEQWVILTRPEDVWNRPNHDPADLDALIDSAITVASDDGPAPIQSEVWHGSKSRFWSFYRGLESTLGGPPSKLKNPADSASGPPLNFAESVRNLPNVDRDQLSTIEQTLIPQLEWSDGISSWLSDAYRSGMCLNFILAALAVIIGAAYLPLGLSSHKWIFASIELVLLLSIVAITLFGKKYDWHTRWFETRRVAEYLRHGPIMLLLGVIRPAGQWPRSDRTVWPENYARHSLRSAGLPNVAIDQAFLREAAQSLLLRHVRDQKAYHRAKAARLKKVDHRLDKIAETLFGLAIISVSTYLVLKMGATFGVLPYAWSSASSMTLTFLGIALPTLGASIAGIRFFCDFDRFATISKITSGKLSDIDDRIALLLAGPDNVLTYRALRDLAHAVDAIVVEELEGWQAVFSGKHISLPA